MYYIIELNIFGDLFYIICNETFLPHIQYYIRKLPTEVKIYDAESKELKFYFQRDNVTKQYVWNNNQINFLGYFVKKFIDIIFELDSVQLSNVKNIYLYKYIEDFKFDKNNDLLTLHRELNLVKHIII
jgi:hypothetical protein